jgi:hypothetical protein
MPVVAQDYPTSNPGQDPTTTPGQNPATTTPGQDPTRQDPSSKTYKSGDVEGVFKEADTNKDSYISWDEAEKVAKESEGRTTGETTPGHMGMTGHDIYERENFNEADVNDDDRLSKDEVKKYYEKSHTGEKSGMEGY